MNELTKGHHYCLPTDDEYSRCCICGDERPYRMVLTRQCPGDSEILKDSGDQ